MLLLAVAPLAVLTSQNTIYFVVVQ